MKKIDKELKLFNDAILDEIKEHINLYVNDEIGQAQKKDFENMTNNEWNDLCLKVIDNLLDYPLLWEKIDELAIDCFNGWYL